MDQVGAISKKASISEDVYWEITSELRLPIKARPLTLMSLPILTAHKGWPSHSAAGMVDGNRRQYPLRFYA